MNQPRPQASTADDDASFSLYAKTIKIYPRAVSGWFARWRVIMVFVTQAVFYGLPWLNWNGRQAVLFDLTSQRFYIGGLMLHPQDLVYLAALMMIAALALFFFTAVAGRLWCGYACPQTVYTEIFLWVERHIEGDRQARMRLDAQPWGAEKLARKGAKQLSWIAIGLFTGFSFVGYFTPIRLLTQELMSFTLSDWEMFWIGFYGFATYGNAGYMREQVCKYMCPYARFQSAMIDADSLVIAYDTGRGDPRGARGRKTDARAQGLGDCVDCTLCVQVCPTGIDIRKGLQNECIGCAACIDVCDGVMDKMGYEKGLIRYSSENGIAQKLSPRQMLARVWRPRVLIYGVLLAGASLAFIISLSMRVGFSINVIKDRGTMARMVGQGQIENVYRVQVMNGTEAPQHYEISVSGLPGLQIAEPTAMDVEASGIGSMPVRLTLPAEQAQQLQGQSSAIQFELTNTSDGVTRRKTSKATFFVPR